MKLCSQEFWPILKGSKLTGSRSSKVLTHFKNIHPYSIELKEKSKLFIRLEFVHLLTYSFFNGDTQISSSSFKKNKHS
jgi:hypothetical protein